MRGEELGKALAFASRSHSAESSRRLLVLASRSLSVHRTPADSLQALTYSQIKKAHHSVMSFFFGARGPKLVEHRICVLSHQAGWSSKKINLAELARLRWIENRSRKEVAEHFGASIETVKIHIRHLRSGRIRKVGLSPDLVRTIKSNWR